MPTDPIALEDGKRLVYPFLAAGAAGAGAAGLSALIKNLNRRAEKKRKVRYSNSDLPALYASTGKSAGVVDSILETIGKYTTPRKLYVPNSEATQTSTVSPTHWAARTIIPLASGAVGAGLGYGTVKKYFDGRDKEKNLAAAEADIDSARKEYFDTLLGAKTSASFDVLYREKAALLEKIPYYNAIAGAPLALAGGAGLLGAAYAGNLAYKKRKEESASEVNRRAVAARDRLRGITPPTISPKEIRLLREHFRAKQDV